MDETNPDGTDDKQIALEMAVKSSAWDETRRLVSLLIDEIRKLRKDIRLRFWLAISILVAAAVLVALMFLTYFLLVSGPLARRVDRLEQSTTTTTSTTTSTTIDTNPTSGGNSGSPRSPQSPATTAPGVTTPANQSSPSTSTTSAPPTTTSSTTSTTQPPLTCRLTGINC